jgi:hypothetical protein
VQPPPLQADRRPKSADSVPPVKAIINTTLYISNPPAEKREANPRNYQKKQAWSLLLPLQPTGTPSSLGGFH